MIEREESAEHEPATKAVAQWLERVARASGMGVALMGLAVLLGWQFDISSIKSILPSLNEMKANTALCFLLAGAALWAAASPGFKCHHAIRTAFAFLIIAIGLATAYEYLVDTNLGIDELLFADLVGPARWGLPAGRMALASALAFVTAGCSLLLLRGRASFVSQLLASVTALTALFSLAAYFCTEVGITGLSPYSSLALHTAIGFVVLAVGLLAAAPSRGPLAVVASGTRSGAFARRLLPAAIGISLGLGVLGAAGQRAGWYGPEYGIALFALTNATVLAGVIIYVARRAFRAELEARESEVQVRRLNEELEAKVLERTARLALTTASLQLQMDVRRRTEEARRQEAARYGSLVQATTAIVWNTPASGEFETEQPGWSAFTGQTFEQLRGTGWLDAVHPDDRSHTTDRWAAAVASRTVYQIEHRLKRHDGVYRYMLIRAVPILTDGGTILEWDGIHMDVDVLKQAEAAQRVAKEAAEEANRAKQVQVERQRVNEERMRKHQAALVALTRTCRLRFGSVDPQLYPFTEASAKTLGADRVSIWRYNPDRTAIRCVDLYESHENRHSAGAELFATDYPAYFQALASADVLDAGDANRDPRTREFSENYLQPLEPVCKVH